MSSPRPKIEVVRVPSSEQAKLRPLVEGGIQLQAEFKHLRCGDYVSYRSLEWGRDCYRFDPEDDGHGKPQHSYTAPPLSTKSCDNIFARQVAFEQDRNRERGLVGSPYLWRDATRSEEMLYCSSGRHQRDHHQTSCRSTGNVQSSSARSRLTALLKKLSPRLHRSSSKPTPCPWVLVEFSSRDLEHSSADGHGCSRDSTTSDKSFDIAVREATLRKEKEKAIKQQLSTALMDPTATSSTRGSRSALIPPQICIGTPEHSPQESQPSLPVSPGHPSGQSLQYSPVSSLLPNKVHHARPTWGSQCPEPPHAVASRPHTLLIQPPVCAAPSLTSGENQPLTCKMASFESIGSCSLDAYATASEASEPPEDETASARTLHSVPVGTIPGTSKVASGASSPEYVKRTARLFETSPSTCAKASTPNIVVENGGTKDSSLLNGIPGKKPSYLGLACSISGYSGITTYDSKLREGFRSRDHSPGRLGLMRSRDTSPLRSDLVADTLYIKSECGNFLTPPNKTGSGLLSKTPLKLKTLGTSTQIGNSELASTVNGAAVQGESGMSEHHLNGIMDEVKRSGHQVNGIPETSREVLSESNRSFMSSMLSDNVDSARTKELSSIVSPAKTASSESKEGPSTSPMKPSPDSLKSVSKDSLSPANSSPQKRSPGAVRVVEFTSQTKSYVKTVISSHTFLQTSTSVDSPFTSISDASFSNQANQQQHVYSSSSFSETNVSSTTNGTASKSFIQQRVERLYGPGALAQGFFRRTRQMSKTQDESQESDASSTIKAHLNAPSNIGLPVLRHLRPEFRAQLPLTTLRRRQSSDVEIEQASSAKPMELQQQISVESVAESLPDMQPAAPEVVLPVETVQPILEGLPISEESKKEETGESIVEKDGHFFLRLLKQEIDRLSCLVAAAEAELENADGRPEEALGKLRAASGQARLLMKQKLQQFEGLCHKNISQSPQEAFPTTSQDLAGFWDMVKLQIDHVDRLFEEIEVLRQAGWVEKEFPVRTATVDSSSSVPSLPKRRSATKRAVVKSSASEEQKKANEAARKAREESRRKMMEERRKAMKQKASKEDSIEIYVPQENGK